MNDPMMVYDGAGAFVREGSKTHKAFGTMVYRDEEHAGEVAGMLNKSMAQGASQVAVKKA